MVKAKRNINDFFVRPTYKAYGVYERTGTNRAKVIYEGSKEQCYSKLKEFQEAKMDKFVNFTIQEHNMSYNIVTRHRGFQHYNSYNLPTAHAVLNEMYELSRVISNKYSVGVSFDVE